MTCFDDIMSNFTEWETTAIYEEILLTRNAELQWVESYDTPVNVQGVYITKSQSYGKYSEMFTSEIDGVFITDNVIVADDTNYRITIDGKYYTRKNMDDAALFGAVYFVGIGRLED